MNLFGLSTAALVLLLATAAPRPADAPSTAHQHANCTATIDDPDPLDCPFCGGNPSVHIRALWAIEKAVVRAHHARLL